MQDTTAELEREGLRFLENIQLVLAESQTNSTYKYALLLALANICVERQSGPAEELAVPVELIAEKFLEIYWRHGLPYGVGIRDVGGGVLLQNRGTQAAVVPQADRLRAQFRTLGAAKRDRSWHAEIRRLAAKLDEMPLWRLQKLRTTTLDFLYPENRRGRELLLRPGIAHHFRRFYWLVVRLVQAEWIAFLHGLPGNQLILGSNGDLSEFLFGPQRESLLSVRDPLRELQFDRCFYCEERMVGSPEVDHFVPWSRYPRNLMHNLVVAHRTCNGNKSDLLAGPAFYVRWREHVERRDSDLVEIAARAGILVDRDTSIHVADWCYAEAERVGAELWLGGERFKRAFAPE